MENSLPTLKDFSSDKIFTLDGQEAVDHFLGKTIDEAKQLFLENDLYYIDDFMWMEKKAFRYYLPAFIDYIKSNNPNISSDTLYRFLSLINYKIEYEIETVIFSKTILLNALAYCLQNYLNFDVNIKIYGDLKSETKELIETISAL